MRRVFLTCSVNLFHVKRKLLSYTYACNYIIYVDFEMTDTTPAPTVQAASRVTVADVRQALGETDPNSTNAGALRQVIGRGSFATIQKYLDAVRAERAPVVPVAPGATPAPPADAVAAIWGAAWAQAQMLTLARLEAVTAERDAARAQVAAQAQDVASLAAEVDAGADAVTAALSAKQQLENDLLEVTQSSGEALQGHKGEIARLTTELEQVKTAAAAAAALAQRDAQIAAAAMQAALDAQIQKYVDLKSVVDHLTPKP